MRAPTAEGSQTEKRREKLRSKQEKRRGREWRKKVEGERKTPP